MGLPQPGETISDRYHLEGVLGQGGMGQVYMALDTTSDSQVALKTLLTGLDLHNKRFHREIRVMSLLSHPNIVTILDSGEHRSTPYYVMEYIAGKNLDQLRLAEGGRLTEDFALEVASQAAEGLRYIHSNGIIHRDLKPPNVMVTEDGQIKIMDFGLARPLESTENLTLGGFIGTPAYMSPEQAQGEELDYRSDLYSLGIILYELIGGARPFSGKNFARLLQQHAMEPPPPLRSHSPEISPPLEEIVSRLLEKDRSDRFQSAEQLLSALNDLKVYSRQKMSVIAPQMADALFPPAFCGRNDEMARLEQGLARAKSANGRAFSVEGETGIGKTFLLKELGKSARKKGHIAAHANCYEREHLGGQPFAEILEDLLRAADFPVPQEVLTSGLNSALGAFSPGLLPIMRTQEATPSGETAPEVDKSQILHAILTVLRRLSAEKPCLVIVEDIQWADDFTLETLHYLSRQIGQNRICLVFSFRDDTVGTGHPIRRMMEKMEIDGHVERMRLGPLSKDALLQMITSMLGDKDAAFGIGNCVYAESEGHPLFTREILVACIEQGTFRRRDGNWDCEKMALPKMPAGIQGIIEARLAPLEEDSKRLLEQAAILGKTFEFDILHLAAEIDEDELIDKIDLFLRRDLIREESDPDRDRYQFAHSKIRDVLLQGIHPRRVKRYHLSAATSIEKEFSDEIQPHAPQLAEHYSAAGDKEKSLRFHLMAGCGFYCNFSNHRAIRHFEKALDLMDQGISSGEIGVSVSDVIRYLCAIYIREGGERSRVIELVNHMKEIGDRQNDNVILARAHFLQSMSNLFAGELRGMEEESRQVIELIDVSDEPELLAAGYRTQGMALLFQGRLEESEQTFLKAISLVLKERLIQMGSIIYGNPGGNPYTGLIVNLSNTLSHQGRWEEARKWLEEGQQLAEEMNDRVFKPFTQMIWGRYHLLRWEFAQTTKLMNESIKGFEELGFRGLGSIAASFLCEALVKVERLEETRDRLEKDIRISESQQIEMDACYSYRNLAETYLKLGDLDKALTFAEKARETTISVGMRLMQARAEIVLAQVLFARDRSTADHGRKLFEGAIELLKERKAWPLAGLAAFEKAKFLRDCGENAAARKAAGEAREIFQRLETPVPLQEIDSFTNSLTS